ncbi:MAG: hypothetical protein IPO90_01660 [Flavobacteriales bacterium]|nr:hypothetical protein [Flavobacteriales bacterium]
MRSIDWKKLLPVVVALAVFIALAVGYFSPVLEGKRLIQGDIRNFTGASRDIVEHRDAYGEEPLWTESMFSGMPAYQISVQWGNVVLTWLNKLFTGFLPMPAGFIFLYLIGMYILLMCLRVDPWLAVVGAAAYAFSSYFIVILEAGHNSKAMAIGYMPMVFGALYLLLRGNKLIGAALFALFLTLLIYVNHVQVAYYLGMLMVLFGLAEGWKALGEKRMKDFLSRCALASIGVVLALLCNLASLWSTYEYGKDTTRGPSELTISADGSNSAANQTGGLDRDYVTHWSEGKLESLSLLVPNMKGGASGSVIKSQDDIAAIADPEFRKEVLKKYQDGGYINSYWGDQEFVSGPVYIGAILVLLVLLMLSRAEGLGRWWLLASIPLIGGLLLVNAPLVAGLLVITYLLAGIFLLKDTLAYSLFSALVLTLLLSWGRFYTPLTDFFLDHIPGYDKFRAVTIILVIVELAAPVLGVLYLDRILREEKWNRSQERNFLVPAGILAVVLLVFALLPTNLFPFFGDDEMTQLADAPQSYVDGLKAMRVGLFTADVWRSLGFVLAGAALLFAFGRRYIGKLVLVALLGLLIVVDLWTVDKRYLNNEKRDGRYLSWEDEAQNKLPFKPQPADLAILQQEQNASTEADFTEARERLKKVKQNSSGANKLVSKDEEAILRFGSLRRTTHFRVLSIQNPFNDARVSYFHKSLGGYHGAKLKRFQELISFRISAELQNMMAVFRNAPTQQRVDSALAKQPALAMLNTKYLIIGNDRAPLRNPAALGAGWFVNEVRMVKNADEEIVALATIDPARTALVDERFAKDLDASAAKPDSTARVTLKSYKANELIYSVKSAAGGVVVFSEIWYGADWVAEIDGQPASYARANYVLRAMSVPAGEHEVRFHIVSKAFNNYASLASISSWLLLVLVLVTLGMSFRRTSSTVA